MKYNYININLFKIKIKFVNLSKFLFFTFLINFRNKMNIKDIKDYKVKLPRFIVDPMDFENLDKKNKIALYGEPFDFELKHRIQRTMKDEAEEIESRRREEEEEEKALK